MYVNPARRGRKAKRVTLKRGKKGYRWRDSSGRFLSTGQASRKRKAAKRAAEKRYRTAKKKVSARRRKRKRLEESARKKRAAKTPARKRTNPTRRKTMAKRRVRRKKRTTTTRRRRNPSSKRSAAARKAARTRKRNKTLRSLAAKKAARSRKRRNPARKRRTTARRVTRRRKRRNPLMTYRPNPRRRKTRRRYRSNPRRTTQKSLRRARRAIKNKYKTSLARGYAKRYRMRSNPAGIKDAVFKAIPIAGGYFGSKVLSNLAAKHVPGLDMLGAFAPVGTSVLAVVGTHFLTKKVLRKHRSDLMLGAGLNVITTLVQSFAPVEVKQMLGMVEAVPVAVPVSAEGQSSQGDYIQTGDYIQVGDIESDLGAFESEMGSTFEADLGDYIQVGGVPPINDNITLSGLGSLYGGTSRASMLRPVPRVPMLAPVPTRSWVGDVPRITDNYDQDVYTGIFAK